MTFSRSLPILIQGGMGAGVSDWRLARSVAQCGHLGVVSGTAQAEIMNRRLQDGDSAGAMRRALAAFPVPRIAQEIIARCFCPGGKSRLAAYKHLPMYSMDTPKMLVEMTVAANFAEVYLAKQGHRGQIGVNYLEKIQLPNLASLYGAMLGGVDYVLMGAGIPREIPAILDRLANHAPAEMSLHVVGAAPGSDYKIRFDPAEYWGGAVPPPLKRPKFLAIISSASLAVMLMRKAQGTVDGFVVELPCAGGHNAAPRGALQLNERGEPVYGAKDEVDLEQMRALGVPFWLAGGFACPQRLAWALQQGAQGIQVGTAFAFCRESGLLDALKQQVLERAAQGRLDVFTDPKASPTGFPFKVVRLPDTQSEIEVYARRQKVCDLGYLRQAYVQPDGTVGFRCPGEPERQYLAKGGALEDTVGRKCLCNALVANIGMPQRRADGDVEKPLLTAGDDALELRRFLKPGAAHYTAADVIDFLMPGGRLPTVDVCQTA